MDFINKMVERFIKLNRRLKQWQRVISVLSAIVVFVTTYALILPAITLDQDTASTQAGMEIATEQIEPEETGTVYESEPEKTDVGSESEPAASEDVYAAGYEDEEDSGSDSGSAAAEEAELEEEAAAPSEESDSAIDEENASDSDGYSDAEGSFDQEPAEESDEQAGSAMTAEIAAEGATDLIAQEIPLITEQTQLFYENRDENDEVDYIVYAEFGEAARLPVGVELQVKEITKESDPEAYEQYCRKALEEMKDRYDENTELSFANFYDISFVYDGAEVEPGGDVNIRIEYAKTVDIRQETSVDAIHFDKEDREKVDVIEAEINSEKKGEEESVKTVEFESDRFSVYGIVGTETIETTYLTADGETYKITVTYGPEAEIPAHSSLYVREVEGNEQEFINSVLEDEGSEQEFIGDEEDREDSYEVKIAVSRTFDIKIMDRDGKEVQPAENSAVKVTFELEEVSNGNLSTSVYHIHEENDGELSVLALDVETQQSEATVVTDSFSYFTVQFSYNGGPVYIGSGDALIDVSTIARKVGLQGTVTGVSVDDPESIILQRDEQNIWKLKVPEPFSGEKTLSVTMDNGGAVGTFEITLKCDVHLPEPYNEGTRNGVRQQGDNTTFLHGCDLATIFILEENMKNPEVSYDDSRFAQKTYAQKKQNVASHIGYTGTLPAEQVTTFDGWCCTLKYKNAAILPDGSLGDIELTFSDVSFYPEAGTTQTTYTANFTNVVEYDNQGYWLPRVESGNDGGNLAVGLEVKVTARILNGDSTAVGNYYYGMRDIDIPRDRAQRAGRVLEAENHYCFSEQVEIVSGAQSVAYIPAASKLNGRYLCGITNNTGSDANGLLFTPTLGTNDPGEYGDGFATLADAGGFQIIVRSAAAPDGSVHTTVSPGSIGGLYARKTVEDGTRLDEQRNWKMDIEIDGTTFVDDHMKHGETVFVGAFARDYDFTAVEEYPNEWDGYETSWLVKAVEVEDGRGVEKEKGSGTGLSANGVLYPRTIIEFVNKRIWIDDLLTVKKIVLNQEDPQELQRDWQFTLTLTDGTGDEEVPITGLAAPAGAQNWTEVGNGVYKFTLKDQESLSIRLPKGCNYSVQEDEYPGYYTTYDHQKGTLPNEKVATVYNMPKPEIRIKKENDKNQFISGAKFKLLYKNDSGSYVQVIPPEEGKDFEIPEDGYEIENMSPGEYKLVETEAPSGYIILTSEYEFKLELSNENGKPSIRPVTQTQDVIIDNENLIITVKNYPGKVLPGTGGSGTLHYTLSGIALMLGAVWMYGFGMRRRVRR